MKVLKMLVGENLGGGHDQSLHASLGELEAGGNGDNGLRRPSTARLVTTYRLGAFTDRGGSTPIFDPFDKLRMEGGSGRNPKFCWIRGRKMSLLLLACGFVIGGLGMSISMPGSQSQRVKKVGSALMGAGWVMILVAISWIFIGAWETITPIPPP